MNFIENNKLIAEFMGLNLFKNSKGIDTNRVFDASYDDLYIINEDQPNWYSTRNLEYDVSWNWLMPVVEKIECTKLKDGGYPDFDIYSTGILVEKPNGDIIFQIDNEQYTQEGKLISVYKACVEFINWYNANNLS